MNDHLLGKYFSLPFLPATPSSPSRTLEGLFELTWRPSQALVRCARNYRDSRHAALGAEIPGHCQQQLTQTLTVCLLKKHGSLIVNSQQNIIELVTRPGDLQWAGSECVEPRAVQDI